MNRSIHILYAIIIAIMIITMAGTAIAAEKTITDYMGVGKLLGAGEGGKQKITFEDDMPNFNQPIEDKPEAITVDEAGKKVYMGGGVRDQKGTLWYTGNSDTANCSNGVCDFCNGLRARFRFRFTDIDSSPNSITHADGFTFAVVSGQNYDPATGIYRSGGAPAAISMGELLGYAGPGLTSDGQGIVPPKMAVEFDTYPNAAVDICGSDSRNDPNFTSPNFQNHIALMYWGVQDIAGVCPAGGATYPKKSYDDNRHGVGGTGNDPANAGTVSSPSGGLYRNPKVNGNNWLEDNAHHWFRIETTRSTTVNSATGKYDYTTRVWIDCATCNATELDNFLNVRANFLDRNGDIRINKTTDISTADHALFERMLFGFTEAAGQPTSQTSQHIELDNFELAWLCGIECVYTLNPASISYDNNGGTGSFDVTSPSGCPWTATQNTLDSLGQPFTWFTITSSASGVGNGTINYTVAPYNVEAATRTGTVMVAKQIFTVTQIGCNYVIDPTELWYDASGGNGQIDVTSPDGCTWTATKSVGLSWVTITSGSSGTGNGRVHYKVDPVGGTTPRSGTITINGKVHTIWQTGCTYGINPMSASYTTSGGTGSVAVTSQTGCPWTATESLDWVSITSGASGSGNGSVGYTVAANTRSISRSGTITITGGQTFTINQAGVPCTYSINPTSASFTAAAGTGSVAVTAAASDCAWMAVSNAAWITNVTPAGGSGNGTVNYSVTFNGTGSPRTGTMTIAGKTFTVTQAACTYSINPESASFTAAAATGSVAVTSPTGCTWTATEGLSWVSITTGATGSGNGTVNYYVKANPSASPRTGTMTIAGLTFTINQAASSCPGQFWAEYFANQSLTGLPSLTRCEVSPLTWDWGTGSPGIGIPSDHFSARWSGEFQFGEAGGYTFTSRTDDGVRVWVDDILIIDHWVDQGPTVYQATITLTAGAHTVVMEYYENLGGAVAQLRWDACTYSINPTSYAAPAGGTTTAQTVSVTTVTGCPWTAASNDAWITRTAPTGTVTGAGTVTYTVAANTTGSTRTGTMTIAGQTFTVTQVSCSYTLGATSYAAPAGGTTTAQTVSVTTPTGCTWTAASNDAWITRTAPTGTVTGSGTVTYTVAANASSIPRTGTMTIAGLTFTVNQAGVACTYSINPSSASFTAAAGTGSVAVTSPEGCAWTATESLDWVSITSGSSGSGNGTVNYSVTANNTGSPRTGAMTIAGLTFTINQWNVFNCSGGTETSSGGYKIHTFTTSGTLTVNSGSGSVEVLVVGGGGGGGNSTDRTGGGGGAGGVVYNSAYSVTANVSVTVGGGGAANAAGANSVFGTITAIGGGRGGTDDDGTTGGSGGGGHHGSTTGSAGTPGQGYAGGRGYDSGVAGQPFAAGGGGGAGGVGAPGLVGGAGNGGSGYTSSISGASVTYAGGGGGGGQNISGGAGGSGGGGAGGTNGTAGTAGTANRGGGGGGGSSAGASAGANGGAAGSGIVIVKYLIQ